METGGMGARLVLWEGTTPSWGLGLSLCIFMSCWTGWGPRGTSRDGVVDKIVEEEGEVPGEVEMGVATVVVVGGVGAVELGVATVGVVGDVDTVEPMLGVMGDVGTVMDDLRAVAVALFRRARCWIRWLQGILLVVQYARRVSVHRRIRSWRLAGAVDPLENRAEKVYSLVLVTGSVPTVWEAMEDTTREESCTRRAADLVREDVIKGRRRETGTRSWS